MCVPLCNDESSENTDSLEHVSAVDTEAGSSESLDASQNVGNADMSQKSETEDSLHLIMGEETTALFQSALKDIFSKVEALESLFAKRLSYDTGKEKILDKLHAELQDYKSDLYFRLTRPIFHDITVVLDDMRKIKMAANMSVQSSSDIDVVAESLLCLLDKYEVLPFSSLVGSRFDAVSQRMIRTLDTGDVALVGLVAESISPGFMQKEQLITPEKVIVYKMEAI